MALDTIYSVGEGRTVVIALDGCAGCLSAFEEFINEKLEPDDRVVALVKGGRPNLPQSKFSGSLLRLKSRGSGALAPCSPSSPLAEREDCKLRNRVVVPGMPLSDFADWDRTARNVLAKLAAKAEPRAFRFEAMRVLAGGRPQHWAEAVMDSCIQLEANLLVIASHKQPKGPHVRSLSAVFAVNPKCPVMVLGKKASQKALSADDVEDEDDEGDDVPGWSLPRTASTLGKTLSKSASFGVLKQDSGDFPNPVWRGGLVRTSSENRSARTRAMEDIDLKGKESVLGLPPCGGNNAVCGDKFIAGSQAKRQNTLKDKVMMAYQKAVEAPRDILQSLRL